ncbi:hypothetical protein SEVIR_3G360932v4 [Setaria viridis]
MTPRGRACTRRRRASGAPPPLLPIVAVLALSPSAARLSEMSSASRFTLVRLSCMIWATIACLRLNVRTCPTCTVRKLSPSRWRTVRWGWLPLWPQDFTCGHWVQRRVIGIGTMLPIGNPNSLADVIGIAEGVGIIFVSADVGAFTVEPKSGRMRIEEGCTLFCSVGTCKRQKRGLTNFRSCENVGQEAVSFVGTNRELIWNSLGVSLP